jgi:mannose-1-phosphate guanylyltransferase
LEKYVVVMAGGTGSRLWPLSREKKPKQFISVKYDKSMLIQTIERVCEIVPAENCFIITNKGLFDITKKAVGDLIPLSNIILEPKRKNTAACIAYASLLLKERLGTGLLCFVPADGYVKNHTDYKSAVEQAYLAAGNTNGLVVIGISPSYPATGYGYIQINPDMEIRNHAFRVNHFVEKPDLDTAKKFISSGDFLWNSGILLGSMDAIIESTKVFLPGHFRAISAAVKQIDGQELNSFIDKAYDEIPAISFDKGVLEKNDSIYAVKGNFDWDDIGSLDALSKTFFSDENGNAIQGRFLCVDTNNSVIYSDGVLVSTIGLENMIIAATKDAILVCPKDRIQDVKSLVEKLKLNGFENLT